MSSNNLLNDKLLLKEIQDDKIRKNFEKVADVTSGADISKFQFQFLTFQVPAGTYTNYKIAHGLRFTPQDILITKQTGSFTFNYDLFDDNFISINVTGPASFRGLVGRYGENTE